MTAYGVPVYGSWCPMWKGRCQCCGGKLKFFISYELFALRRRGKKIQLRRVFKDVSYPAVIKSIACPYISSPLLPPPSYDPHVSRSRFGQQLS